MTNTQNGEFKGTVKEAIADIRSDIAELKADLKTLKDRYWFLLIILLITLADKIPQLIGMVVAK